MAALGKSGRNFLHPGTGKDDPFRTPVSPAYVTTSYDLMRRASGKARIAYGQKQALKMNLELRIATSTDMPQIADLRWRLKVDDEPIFDRDAYEYFIAEFVRVCEAEWSPSEIVHWIAADAERVVAVMSIVIVRILPCHGDLRNRWGYVTNS